LTPTFYVYEMFREHQGAQSLRTELANTAQISDAKQSRPAINASASHSSNSVLITVVNQSPSTGSELRINLRGARAGSAAATSLSGPNVRSQNTFSQPQTVVPKPGQVELDGGELVAQIPAGSIQAIRVQLA